MLNFTVGPVQSNEATRRIGGEQLPYFRTSEFSEVMLENEELVLSLLNAPAEARAVFLTGSGTASMEASILNVLTSSDRALIVEAGDFGRRFCEICSIHKIPHETLQLSFGKRLTAADLAPFEGRSDLTSFVVNIHETSTGVHFDTDLIADFCKRNNLLLIIDAISSFLADPLDMRACGADVVISGSQKALACPPGISLIALSPRALRRVWANETKCFYLDLKSALKNAERGQTPFTPAVGVLLQINERLHQICSGGGLEAELQRTEALAVDFRNKIAHLPFTITSEALSNAVTPIRPLTAMATTIFEILKSEYGIWICPSSGDLKETLLRVGHIGDLTFEDNDALIAALEDMQSRGLI